MKKLITICSLSIIVFACSHKTKTSVSKTEETTAPSPKISAEAAAAVTMETKGALYAASCARCHKLVEPSKFTKDEWVHWLDKMAPKAKITAEQKAQIYDYVSANAKVN